MSSQSETTPSSKITPDGLRYARKTSGSIFGSATLGATTMSCFKCGKHRPRNELMTRRFLGRNQVVCREGCEVRP